MNDDDLLNFLQGMTGKVDTGSLAASTGTPRHEMFEQLNNLAKKGRLERSGMLLENGTPRPTLGFGWQCPTD